MTDALTVLLRKFCYAKENGLDKQPDYTIRLSKMRLQWPFAHFCFFLLSFSCLVHLVHIGVLAGLEP